MVRFRATCTQLVVIISIFLALADSVSRDPFEHQPRISVENGHMILRGALDKNVTLLSSGGGSVFVNDVEISSLSLMAKQLISGNVRSPTVDELNRKVQDLESRLDSVSNIATQFELLQSNISSLTSRVGTGGSRAPNGRAFRNLQRKVTTLENQVKTLTEYLTKDECSSNPCRNGGTCVDAYNGFICQCTSKWEGPTCESDVNECARYAGTGNGCQNGATCYNSPGSYRCECQSNWFGVHCSSSHDDCSSASHTELCGHGTCVNENRVQPGQPKYRCICDEGWRKGSGPACDQDVDECASNEHRCSKSPSVLCINIPGSYHCGQCPYGYTGNGWTCSDINECLVNNGGCHPLVTCLNNVGSRQCGPCPAGYVGDGTYCSFSGVCANGGGCHPLATCIANSAITGTFRECRCPHGYTGSGEGLTGCVQGQTLQTCASNPCVHGSCQMTATSYYCVCYSGYTGSLCDQRIDPCSSQPCLNGGTCVSSTETNELTCVCAPNFEGPRCAVERQSCGGEFNTPNGTIKYPSTTGTQYAHRENCVWIISTENPMVLNITINYVHIETGYNCAYDFLQINDGRFVNSKILGRYCGNQENQRVIQSTHSVAYVWFHSDHSVAGYGFNISWTSVNASCGADLDIAPFGAIESPSYPGNYPRNRDCYWHVKVRAGSRIQFHFATLKLEHHENCSFDFLKLYDGSQESDPLLATYCTTETPQPEITSGSTALLYFHTDRYIEDTGFHITYAAVPGVPGCGGILTSPTGSVTSPNYPDTYDRFLLCEWTIRVHTESRIKLSFTTFQLESHSSCSFDYVEVHDGADANAPLLGLYCGTENPPDILSNGNQLYVKFRTDSTVQSNGFKAVYKTICGGTYTDLQGSFTSPYYPDPYPSMTSCMFIISLPAGNLIQLEFPVFGLESTNDCDFDYVQVRDGATESSPLVGQYCGTALPEPFISTYNQLLVKFITDGSVSNHGFYANYTNVVVGCGGVFTNNLGSVSTPAHPNYYPPSITCNWILRAPAGNVVRLTFETFVIEYHLNCEYDYVIVRDSNGAQIGKYCGVSLPPVLTSTDNEMQITFVADASVLHEGFNATYTFLDTSTTCGGEFYTATGVVRSPGFPNNYPHSRRCTWVLHAESGQQVTLNFTSFHLETHTSCNFDYLEIRNGGSEVSPLIGKYCGEVIPPILVSHSNVFRLTFVTDRSQTAPGFEVFYDTATTGCGGSLTGPSGSIVSPHYPQSYGHNAECTWKITVSQGSAIALFIIDSDIEAHADCNFDYLEIFDGPTENSKSIIRICNSHQPPAHIRSSKNSLFIKFRTDSSMAHRGFHLTYRMSCVNELTARRGVIESPNFPNLYPHNQNCTWTIRAPVGSNLTLSFSHLFLEHTSTCIADFIEVNESENTQLAKFCGTPFPLPPMIRTSSNVAVVRLVTDSSVTREGFRLEYTVQGCGGKITRSYEVITSPNYPDGYPLSTECIWTVEYTPGSRVTLQVTDLDLEWHSECRFDYLKAYGGEDDSAPRLLNLCTKFLTSQTITSHGNHMYIHFVSDNSLVGRGFRAVVRREASGCGGQFTVSESDIMSPSYPQNYNVNDECDYYINIDNTHIISLEIIEFSLPQSVNCTNGFVAIYDGANTSMPLLAKLCGEKPENSIINATSNEMLVRLHGDGLNTAKGFRIHYKPGCGRRFIADFGGEVTTPNYPHSPYRWEPCNWIITASNPGDRVTLIFTHFVAPYGCVNEETTFLEVRDGDQMDSPLIGRYCGSEAPPPITSRGNSLHLHKILHGNFRATYGITSSHCGGTFKSAAGSFASPDYPNNYPMGSECIWILEASAGSRVHIAFRSFKLVQSDYCNVDYVEIHENDAMGPLIGRYCGENIPSNVTAVHRMWIKFRSDEASTESGFLAYYSLVYGSEITNATEGIIESPGYPLGNQLDDIYKWLITVDQNRVISVQFLEIDIRKYYDACGQSVKLFDGSDENAPEIAEICGYLIPEPIVTNGNQLFIMFTSYSYTHVKWRLKWTAVEQSTSVPLEEPNNSSCWHMINLNNTGEPIEFSSPGYPTHYESNLNCTWIIQSSLYEHVLLNFTDIAIDGHESYCSGDQIKVYIAPETYLDNWVLNTTLCGRTNATIESPNNLFKIEFTTDYYYYVSGFHAIAQAGCGGHLVGPTGHLHSSDIAAYMAVKMSLHQGFECEWVIKVRSKRTILITFDSFVLPTDSSCRTIYMLFFNGGQSTSPYLGNGRYCSNSVPHTLETSSNQALIKLHVSSFFRGAPFFSLRYTEVSQTCGGHLFVNPDNPTVEVQSPNFPNPPSHPLECSWTILSPSATRMRIDFDSSFNLNYGCYRNDDDTIEYVDLFDGGTPNSELIKRLCGSTHPSSLMTTGNALHISYFTGAEHASGGFKATIQTAECGGILTAYYGFITSPNFPSNYSSSQECEWIIRAPETRSLQLTLLNLDTPPAENCSLTDYVEIREENKDGELKGIFCGNMSSRISPEISTLTAYVKFKSNSAVTSTGFKLNHGSGSMSCGGYLSGPSGTFTSPNYPAGTARYFYCSWYINAPEGRVVTINFNELNLPRDQVTQECVNPVRIQNPNSYLDVQTYCGLELPPPIISTTRSVIIRMVGHTLASGEGFSLSYNTDREAPCGGILSQPTGLITMTNITEIQGTSVECVWKIDANRNNATIAIKFHLLDIPGNYTNYCRGSLLSLNEGYGNQIARFCGNMTDKQPLLVIPVTTFIRLFIYPRQPANGINATYNVNDCGGLIEDQNAEIISPGYPSGYPPNTDCAWLIRVPYGETIQLATTDMRLEENCASDYVIVRNGISSHSPKLGKFCGTTLPTMIQSDSNRMVIHFHSDAFGTAPGFRMSLSEVQRGCGGLIHTTSGTLTSPNYPSRYGNSVECVWTIEFQQGYRVNITFVERFDLEQSENCLNDYVQIEDYDNDVWNVHATKCGSQSPPVFISSRTKMRLTFHSNVDINGDGFKIVYSAACGGHFTDVTGIITSPNYPEFYENRLDCEYIIGEPDKYSALKFDPDQFSIEGATTCRYDYLRIYMGNTTNGDLHGEYCGTNAPQSLTIFGQLLLIFHTDWSYVSHGFHAEYEITECGGVLTKEFGRIRTPKIEDRYMNLMQCTWTIVGRENHVIALKFKSFRVEHHATCGFDSLEIFDGNTTSTNKSIAKLCGIAIPPIVKSTSNIMTVEWRSDYSVTLEGFEAYYYNTFDCGGVLNGSTGEFSSLDFDKDGKYEPNMDCIWHITGEAEKSIQLIFSVLDVEPSPNGTCLYDFIEVRDGLFGSDPIIDRFCGSRVISPIRSTGNMISVVFHSDSKINMQGFRANYISVPTICGPSSLSITNVSEIITSPNYPAAFPSNIICRWNFRNELHERVLFTFDEFNIPCSDGYLEVHSRKWDLPAYRLCGPTHPHNFTSSSDISMYLFAKDNTVGSKGFSLSYVTTGCAANYTSNYGTIINPGYPYYGYHMTCDIHIDVEPGKTIALYFLDFYLYTSTISCQEGNITIYDGSSTNSPVLGAFCGSLRPNPVFSTGRSILWKVSTQSNKYFVSYTTSDKDRGCGGVLNHVNGTFTSPLYPLAYNKTEECVWQLSVPGHHSMTLQFDSFSLTSTSGCTTNYVEIYEGHDESLSNRVNRLCGDNVPAVYTSQSSQLLVKLVTNVTNTAPGFVAIFQMNSVELSISPSTFVISSSSSMNSVHFDGSTFNLDPY